MKRKLKFHELEVKSFVTSISNQKYGAGNSVAGICANPSLIPQDSVCQICFEPTRNPLGCHTQIPEDSVCRLCYAPTKNPAGCGTYGSSAFPCC